MRALVVVNGGMWGAGLLAPWFDEAGLHIDAVRPRFGDEVPVELSHDALVVLPGSIDAHDDIAAPWYPAVRSLFRQAVDRGVPALGICVGAQLLALSGGGTVEHGRHGGETGVLPLTLTDERFDDPLFTDITALTSAVFWHHDIVAELPRGAVALARTARYPHSAFRLGDAAWGLQFHPEATVHLAAWWAYHYRRRLRADGLDPAAVLGAVAVHEPRLAERWRGLVMAFVDVVRQRADAVTPALTAKVSDG